MNVYFFFVTCCFVFLYALVIQKKDILSPLTLTIASFLIVSFICWFRNGVNSVDIRDNTFFILFFCLIESIIIYSFLEAFSHSNNYIAKKTIILRPKLITIHMLIILSIVCLLYRWYTDTKLVGMTITSNPITVTKRLFMIKTYTNYERDYISTLGSFFIDACGYFSSFSLLSKQNVLVGKKRNGCYIILLIFLISKLISGNRSWVIKYFVVCLIYSTYNNKTKLKNYLFKNIKRILSLFLIFILAFGLLGILTGKTSSIFDVGIDLLYSYSGGSIIAFDKLINNEIQLNGYIAAGYSTFNGVIRFLVSLHIIPEYRGTVGQTFVPVDIGGTTTNIYPAMGMYYVDFGLFGVFSVQAFVIIISFFLYKKIRREGYNCSPTYYLFYGVAMYGIAMQGIGPEFTRKLIDFENVFMYIFFLLILVFNEIISKLSIQKMKR